MYVRYDRNLKNGENCIQIPYFQILDFPDWPRNACSSCITTLKQAQLFKVTVVETQTQIKEALLLKPIKQEDDVETVWCPTSDTHVYSDADEKEQFVKSEEEDEDKLDVDFEPPNEDSNESCSEPESEVPDTPPPPQGVNKRKYRKVPKMPSDAQKLVLEKQFKDMGLLKCKVCGVESAFIAELIKHVREHHPHVKYQFCCGLSLLNISYIHHHMEFHRNPEAFKCSHCDKSFSTKESLRGHIYQIHKEDYAHRSRDKKEQKIRDEATIEERLLKKFRRKVKKITLEESRLIGEMRTRGLLKCHICEQEQETHFDVYIHTMEVHQTRGFISCCDNRLASPRYAYDHMRSHLNPDQFKCDQCDRRFITYTARQHHKVRQHTSVEDRKFKCVLCEKSFSSANPLKRHMQNHIPEKERPHKCPHCGQGFNTVPILNEHINAKHNKQSNFVCETCGQAFTTLKLLQIHRRKHDEDIKAQRLKNRVMVPCNLCGKKFVGSRNIVKHQATSCSKAGHQFFCPVCGKQCKSQRSLSLHVKVHGKCEKTRD